MPSIIITAALIVFMFAGRVQAGVLTSEMDFGGQRHSQGFTCASSDSEPVRDEKSAISFASQIPDGGMSGGSRPNMSSGAVALSQFRHVLDAPGVSDRISVRNFDLPNQPELDVSLKPS